ncbi:MAG: homocysteine biosynthesis protein, partial [Chloroflexia bacterium]
RAVEAVREATGILVCADSSSPAALRAALERCPDVMVNSVTADPSFMDELLPAVADSEAVVVGITKDGAGIPARAEERLVLEVVDLGAPQKPPPRVAQVPYRVVAEGTVELAGRSIPITSLCSPTRAARLAEELRSRLQRREFPPFLPPGSASPWGGEVEP